jgi:hypothetical protein
MGYDALLDRMVVNVILKKQQKTPEQNAARSERYAQKHQKTTKDGEQRRHGLL